MAGYRALSDVELYVLLQGTAQNPQRAMAQASSLRDWPARQLSALRNTYPAWEIDRERDPSGQECWTARLRRKLTIEMATAGVERAFRQPDAIALMTALAWQSHLIRRTDRRDPGKVAVTETGRGLARTAVLELWKLILSGEDD
ncbi:hypothetical protein AB0I81_12535 [Nonomuraea sp. NPDC050404]|uniref:hypothetical protein n=1 Tax=Nonomuraea sp. NPDC050404 TaxID=3155783 RepID=UPI0033EC36F6